MSSASSPLELAAREVVQHLQDAGYRALYAGGCVRDMLRNVEPHDYDIATDARPADVKRLFARTVAVGAQFGVVCVQQQGAEFQVASFRSDGVYVDGRHASHIVLPVMPK